MSVNKLRSTASTDGQVLSAQATVALLPTAVAGGTDAADGAAPVLRVLSGRQAGARAMLRGERCLVGNLAGECDIVLDLPETQPHACLLRCGTGTWTALAVAGELRKTGEPVQHLMTVRPGEVLTLGGIDFDVVADGSPGSGGVQPFSAFDVEGSATAVGSGGSLARPRTSRTQWVGMVLALLLVSLGIVVQITQRADAAGPLPVPRPDTVTVVRTAFAEHPQTAELHVTGDALDEKRVLLSGYLPQRADAAALQGWLHHLGVEAEHRWVGVDELLRDLSRRVPCGPDERLRYLGAGAFELGTSAPVDAARDRAIRRAVQELPALAALQVSAVVGAGAEVAPMRYERAGDAPGGVRVTGRVAMAPPSVGSVVTEVRHGALPSVVLADGARYFVGSAWPGGGELVAIHADSVLLRTAMGDISVPVPVAEQRGTSARRLAATHGTARR